jgi:hypothetical protein
MPQFRLISSINLLKFRCRTALSANPLPRRALNPDSAVPADAMSEEQTFRSERSLSLEADPPLAEMGLRLRADIDHRWFKMKSKTYNGGGRFGIGRAQKFL